MIEVRSMGWVSYLEDIKKQAEHLEQLCQAISTGQYPATDGYRAKVMDIAKAVRRQIGDLENVLRLLSPESQRIVNEILHLRKENDRIEKENAQLRSNLKEAYVQNEKLREERDEERKKFRFVVRTYTEGGITKLVRYLGRISH
jgi:chromosome segregation ATPase